MEKLVLSAIGVVTPIGIGKDSFWNGISDGHSGISDTNGYLLNSGYRAGRITGFDPEKYTNDKRFRRAAGISKYALAAVRLLMDDAGEVVVDGTDTALISGITHGALNYTQEFHRALLQDGVDAISPILFSDSVLNAPAGNLSICFSIKGPVHTLVGGPEITVKSIALAYSMVLDRLAGKTIVVSAEELNEISYSCYSRLGSGPLSEGAGAILIEKENDTAVATPYCLISAAASFFDPSSPGSALSNAIDQCLRDSRLSFSDIDLVLADPQLPLKMNMGKTPFGSIYPLTGNAFSVTSMWHIILAALCIDKNKIPESIIMNKEIARHDIRNIMVCSADGQGIASAAILSGRLR